MTIQSRDVPAARATSAPRHARSAIWIQPVLCVAFLLGGCAGDSDDVPMSEGASLYAENCASCHGATALGDGSLASTLPVEPPALKEHLGHHSSAQLIRLIQDGVPPAMPPTPLEADEIQLIVDYLWTLVPADEVAGLRAMQERMEMSGDSGMSSMPEMGGMGGMGAMPGMDSTGAHMQMDSSASR